MQTSSNKQTNKTRKSLKRLLKKSICVQDLEELSKFYSLGIELKNVRIVRWSFEVKKSFMMKYDPMLLAEEESTKSEVWPL